MMDIYRNIVSFMKISDMPIVCREYLKSYILKKWLRLGGVPVLVDIMWHAPGFCHKYCVCKVATTDDRMYYYNSKHRI
tara:strand:- start:3813 stop:4046 length:234 start_codon:yes stop_codon:yes gene_type:complete